MLSKIKPIIKVIYYNDSATCCVFKYKEKYYEGQVTEDYIYFHKTYRGLSQPKVKLSTNLPDYFLKNHTRNHISYVQLYKEKAPEEFVKQIQNAIDTYQKKVKAGTWLS